MAGCLEHFDHEDDGDWVKQYMPVEIEGCRWMPDKNLVAFCPD